MSIVPFVWRDLQRRDTCTKVLRCSPRDSPEGDPFYMQVPFSRSARVLLGYSGLYCDLLHYTGFY